VHISSPSTRDRVPRHAMTAAARAAAAAAARPRTPPATVDVDADVEQDKRRGEGSTSIPRVPRPARAVLAPR